MNPADRFKPRMMPGQEPYTPKEMETLARLVADAARATEYWTEDELEQFAEEEARSGDASV